MALLWIDGFDHYRDTSGNITTYEGLYNAPDNASNFQRTSTSQSGASAARFNQSTNDPGNGVARDLTSFTSIGTGFYTRINSGNDNDTVPGLIVLADLNTHLFVLQFDENTGSDRTLSVRDAWEGSSFGDSGSTVFQDQVWYHIEMQVEVDATNGRIEVRVDNVPVINLTGINTGTTAINRIYLGTHGSNVSVKDWSYDDWYVYDLTGSDNNDWLGERTVRTIFPTADESPSDWTLATGTDGFEMLNNIPPDTNEYIESDTVGDESQFALDTIPTEDIVINGINILTRGSRTGTETVGVETGLRINGSSYFQSAEGYPQDDYEYSNALLEDNPDTTSDWLPTDINNMSLRFRRDS